MSPIKINDLVHGLERKGFIRSEGDHSHFVLYLHGKRTLIRTKISHGDSEIGDRLIGLMSCQLGLDKKKFMDLIYCPLTLDGYIEELHNQGVQII